MNDHIEYIQAAMAEATRLTRAGQLSEATALIQRTLRNGSTRESSAPNVDKNSVGSMDSKDASIEAAFHVVDGSSSEEERTTQSIAPRNRAYIRGASPHLSARAHMRSPSNLHTLHGQRRVLGQKHGQTESSEAVSSLTNAGGQFVEKVYASAVGTRRYKLYIPSGYTGQAVPLVVMLHGCTQVAADFAAGTGMNVIAEERTFLVAYPEQGPTGNSSKCWNWFKEGDQHRDRGEPALIAGVTRQIIGEYAIDRERVYIAGLSSGGAMAAIMAVTYPDLYAAVGVHSGLAYGAAHDLPSAFTAMKQGKHQNVPQLSEAIPLIVFHGDRDTTVAVGNADCLLNQWLQRLKGGKGQRRRSTQDDTIERGQMAGGHAYTRSTYHDSDGRIVAEKWLVHQAGHAWAGGSSAGSYTDPKGPDASAEMMRFFNDHPRRNL